MNVTVTNVSCGPTVTRYELQPEMGVKVSKIVGLADDIKLNLATPDIRIEAPIPGKAAVGIEVPNKENSTVMLRDLLQSEEFQKAKSKLSFAVGKDIAGKTVVADIAKMPHLLIAGATGSGKSVCINTLIISILYKANPDEVKLIMIDPKVVELSVYNGIPHLFIPVVTDPKKAAGALNWAVQEMTNRYNAFAEYGVRNLDEYNRKAEQIKAAGAEEEPVKMPQIVIIVDELADLMTGCARRGGGCYLSPGPACTCGRYPSDHCHTEAVCKCYHRSDQGEYAFQNCFLCIFRCGFQDNSGYERSREASWKR